MSRLIVLTFLVTIVCSMNLFGQVPLTKKNGAMCMDGTQANVYTFMPDDVDPVNKLMIYFEGVWQGWCPKSEFNTTVDHCYKYIHDDNFINYGSSKNYPSDELFFVGILSFDSIFAAYPKIIIKTCDGGSFFSDSTISYKNKTLNFRGKKNVIEALNYLKSINWIQNRDEVILAGQLNGGLAALAWADQVKKYTKGKVRVLADAAVWENDIDQKKKLPVFENRMKNMQKLFLNNGATFPNQKCQQANADNVYKCFYASELVKYIDSSIDILFLQSYYDGWALTQILNIECAEQFASLSECTEEHRKMIQDYHKKVSGSLHQMIKRPNVAAFGIACVAHIWTNGRFDDDTFQVPMGSQMFPENVTKHWLANKPDRNHLDEVQWPHNVPCSRKVIMNLAKQ